METYDFSEWLAHACPDNIHDLLDLDDAVRNTESVGRYHSFKSKRERYLIVKDKKTETSLIMAQQEISQFLDKISYLHGCDGFIDGQRYIMKQMSKKDDG